MGWLVFVDDFNSLTWERVNPGRDGQGCADERNKRLDEMGLDPYGRWFYTPTQEAFLKLRRENAG